MGVNPIVPYTVGKKALHLALITRLGSTAGALAARVSDLEEHIIRPEGEF